METNTAIRLDFQAQAADFRAYLENSLRNPFNIDLRDCSLMEVIKICSNAKSKLHPNYHDALRCLIYNLGLLEERFHTVLMPIQVTDIFWGYFMSFCRCRGLRDSTIGTMCQQLRSILNWAVKYNASVAPSYSDLPVPKDYSQEIALSADEVSRITYFDIDRYYTGRRADFRETMRRVRDMFVLSCNLFQRHSDMVRIEPSCFDRNIFRIRQQKTGQMAVVNIDLYAIDAKTTYRLLEEYHYEAPYRADIGNYNNKLHELMQAIGLDDPVRIEEHDMDGRVVARTVPKWKLISSHTARRTAITINVLRGNNLHVLKRCSGHADLRCFDRYVRDDN